MTTTLCAPRPDTSADFDWDPLRDFFDPEFDDPPPAPPWVIAACAERDRARLAHAATQPVDLESLTALTGADPSTLDGDGLLDAIAAAQRLINHAQALQQRYLAALARPGIAVPLASLVDSALHPTGQRAESALGIAGDLPKNLPITQDGGTDYTPLLYQPEWRRVLADQAARFASAEVSCLLGFAPVTARLRIENALTMVDELPATLAAQQRGDLDGYRASIIAERTAVLSPELRHDVERRLLPLATKRTSSALRRIADREVIAADTTAAEHRTRYANARRGVTVDAAEDGMATLRLFASAANTALVHGVLNTIATSITAAGLADGRGSSQLRADAMIDLFRTLNHTGHAHIGTPSDPGDTPPATGILPVAATGAAGTTNNPVNLHDPGDPASVTGILPVAATGAATTPCCGHPRADTNATARPHATARHGVTLNVYVDAATLAGLNNHPGELAGFGAITADTARALARSADSIRAIITRPAGPNRACGTALDAGRTVYRPPTAVTDYVTARDRTCQFPGCRAPASRCDIDHRQAFDNDGDTCPHNLDLLCRTHHRTKTFSRWHAEPGPTGLLTWTSPLGHTYTTEPSHLMRAQRLDGDPTDDPPPF